MELLKSKGPQKKTLVDLYRSMPSLEIGKYALKMRGRVWKASRADGDVAITWFWHLVEMGVIIVKWAAMEVS